MDEIVLKTRIDTSGIDVGIKEIENKLKSIQKSTVQIGATVEDSMEGVGGNLEELLNNLGDRFEKFITDFSEGFAEGFSESMAEAQAQSEATGKSLESMVSRFDTNTNAIANTTANIEEFLYQTKQTNEQLGDSEGKSGKAAKGVDLLKRAFGGIGGVLTKAGDGLKDFLKKALSFTAVVGLVKKAISVFKQQMNLLADSGTSTGDAIQKFNDQMTQFKNAITAAFAPIINVVLPIMTQIMEKLTEMMNKVAMFIASLFGQTTAIQSVTKATNDEAKAQKKLQSYLTGVDEVRKNSQDAGDAGNNKNTGFKEVPIDPKVAAWADKLKGKLKEIWEQMKPFRDALNRIVEKTKEWFEKIDWQPLLSALDELSKKIAPLFNAIGEFFEKVWEKIVLPALSYFIETLLPVLIQILGSIIEHLTNIFTDTTEWLDQVDFEPLSKSIEDLTAQLYPLFDAIGLFIETVWKKIVLPAMQYLVEKILPPIISFLSRIANLITRIINKTTEWLEQVDFGPLKEAFDEFGGEGGQFDQFLKGITDIGEVLLWLYEEVVLPITQWFIEKILPILVRFFGETIGGLGEMFSGIKDLIEGFKNGDMEQVKKGLGNFFKGLWKISFAPIKAIALSIWEQLKLLWSGIKDAWGKVTGKLKEWFGKLKEKYWEFWGGIWDKLVEVWGKITGFFSDIFTKIGEAWRGFWEGVREFFSGIWEKIRDFFLGIRDKINAKIDEWFPGWRQAIKAAIELAWENLKKWVAEKWNDIKEWVAEKWNDIKEWVAEKWNAVKEWFGKVKEKFDEVKEMLREKVLEPIKQVWNDIKTWWQENIWSKIVEVFNKVKEKFGEFKETIQKKIFDPLKEIWGKIKEFWREKIWAKVTEKFNKLKEKFSEFWEGMKTVMKAPINGIITFINGFLNGVLGGINKLLEKLNSFRIDLPPAIAERAGIDHVGFNIPLIDVPQIPLLAQGAVIPANKEFLAVLGDQKHGNNIEAPEDLLRQIVREESGSKGNTYNVTATANRKVLFEMVLEEGKSRQQMTGRNPFAFA